MIIIEPQGGLVDRLLAIASAKAYARDKKKRLILLWVSDPLCNCRYSRLFQVQKEFSHIIEIKAGFLTDVFKKSLVSYFSMFPNFFLDSDRMDRWRPEIRVVYKSVRDFLSGVHDYNNVYLRTSGSFYQSAFYRPYRDLVPAASIENKIKCYDTRDKVGVDLMLAANKNTVDALLLERMVACIQKEIETNPGAQFFVATDDPSSRADLTQLFSGQITDSGPIPADRHSPDAVQDQVVDLFCLADCRKIIGSASSSFLTVAAGIRGAERAFVEQAQSGETA